MATESFTPILQPGVFPVRIPNGSSPGFTSRFSAIKILSPTTTPAPPVPPSIAYYRMRGYYLAGSAYEFWNTTDVTSPPPSGHTLVSVVVEDTWTV